MSEIDHQIERESVIAEARTWLKTPHHNGACIKGVGVDCGQFPWAVYHHVGIVPDLQKDLRYSPQFHLNSDEEFYLDLAQKHGRELPEGQLPKKADFVLYRIGKVFSHGAIVLEWPLIIHAAYGIGVTIDHGDKGALPMTKGGKKRDIKFFTPW